MSSSSFLTDPRPVLVADTSVLINLNATGCARDIMAALPNRWAVTANARAELIHGMRNGHDDAGALQSLIDARAIDIVTLGEAGGRVYETLINGSALRTLDDGEAATIAYACEASGIALIDERKAMSLCAGSFPELPVVSTAELLLHEAIVQALGPERHISAITGALLKARMRVPPAHIARLVAVIGDDVAASCMSLPKTARTAV